MKGTLRGLPKASELELVALDLDGTVICPYGKAPVSQRCLAAVTALQRAGLPVTFVTGRTEDYALPIARTFGVVTPLVTYNGGRLFSPNDERTLFQATVAAPRVEELLGWLDTLPDVVAVYWGSPRGLKLVQNRCSGDRAKDDYLFGTPRQLVDKLFGSGAAEDTLSKVIVVTREPLEQSLQSRFGDDLQAVRTHPELFEILPGGVNKGSGVARLCRFLDLDPARVLAVGDQDNDVATFRTVGYSVAMGDAPESVKAAAGWVTADFAEEGCAKVLEALL